MKNLLRIFLFIFISISLFSKESLETFEIKADRKSYFIHYSSPMTEVRNKTYNKDGISYTDVILTRLSLSRKDKTDYLVRFGYSKQTGSVFYLLEAQKKGYKEVLKYSGKYMTLPGDNTVRIYGTGKYSVPEIRMFQKTNKGLVEKEQDVIYIDFKSTAAMTAPLYFSSNLKRKVHTLDVKEKLTVIFRKGSFFYVVSKTGKFGWLNIPENTSRSNTPIKDLYGVNMTK